MKIKKDIRLLLSVFIIWIVFSLLYGYAAYNKPFHVDEFYSWVYSERCTYSEILQLRDGGIGHPPLYHIVQKTVQRLVKSYNFINVRMANYLFGSAFVIALSLLLFGKKCHPLFVISSCLSATVIDCFIFSRMWGLVALISVLLVLVGERYSEEGGIGNVIIMLLLTIIGLFADYVFVLLLPYIAILLLSEKKHFNKLMIVGFSISIVLFILFNMYKVIVKMSGGYFDFLLYLFYEIKDAGKEMMLLLFDFEYKELLFFSVLIFSVMLISIIRARFLKIKVNYISIAVPIKQIWRDIKNYFTDYKYSKSANRRLVLSIACALMFLLVINPLMWRDLIYKRFLFTLYPLILLLIIYNLNQKILYFISAMMILALILYIPSNKVADFYPPPAVVRDGSPILFHNELSYSTHYLKVDYGNNIIPLIFDFSKFEMNCRICKMGTSEFNFEKYNEIRIVGHRDFKHDKLLPYGFRLVATQPYLSALDRLLFSKLTPKFPFYFCVYTYSHSVEKGI